jgi:hypothetical protein
MTDMPDENDICIDLSKFRRKEKKEASKTFLCWPQGTEGFTLINELREKLREEKIDAKAEDIVVEALKMVKLKK